MVAALDGENCEARVWRELALFISNGGEQVAVRKRRRRRRFFPEAGGGDGDVERRGGSVYCN
jgi:hypothetical protein